MKAREKGTREWKEYKEVFGPNGEFLGLETLGYWQSNEDYYKENGIPYDPENPFNSGDHYKSAVLPLECFDLWEEPDWSAFRREAAKEILPAMINWRRMNEAGANILISKEEAVKLAIEYADELILQLKEEKK